ncbi:hypothetical protein BX285_0850 [Streptomyces sp. 1114.5]|uniref:hypothetical protein n=1 Tax=unclassified Streptomyces TaxID=2593676 RepID=UPI000BCB124B|nr:MULTISPECIES: hypothetical protein [unclassified Streptomyces]RKT16511.1 hypothetical protein BX285_0850 [Streptomyces sp. 1114.5]SOB82681.1 hypothetical protein SAMN06272789_2855 [Streptomyces sp. 1331.2]
MLSKRLVSTAAICLVLAAGTAACGDNKGGGTSDAKTDGGKAAAPQKLDTDKLSAQDIEKQAKDALASATSLKMSGTIASDDGKMQMNLTLDNKSQCTGTMTMPGMGSFEIISDGKTSYVKPDKEFWTNMGGPNGAKAAELFKGRYLTGFESDPSMSSLTSVCNLADFSKKITEDDNKSSKVEKGTAGNVNGVKTFSLKATDDKGEVSTISVATEGKPYPVRIEHTGAKDGNGQIDFSDFDKPLTIQAPSADNTIDFTKFKDQIKTA